jgi:hypothetical protein
MIAEKLLPFYRDQAKERQVQSGGDVRRKTVPPKVAEPNRNG